MKKISTFLLAVLTLSIIAPGFSFAAPLFTITNFTAAAYEAGEEYTITLDSFSDLEGHTVTVMLGDLDLETTDITKNIIKGPLPEGLPAAGGTLTVKYSDTPITYRVKVPVITKLILPEVMEKDAEVIILGENFDPENCSFAFVGGGSLSVSGCAKNRMAVPLSSNFTGGDLVINAHGFKSQPYSISFAPPVINFITAENGIKPGNTIKIYGENFDPVDRLNVVTLGGNKLEVLFVKGERDILSVVLPDKSITGEVKVFSKGIQSNGINLEVFTTPILTGYKNITKNDKKYVQLSGYNFSISDDENRVTFGTTKANVRENSSNPRRVDVEVPSDIENKCISISVAGQKSNCIEYRSLNTPIVHSFPMPSENIIENSYDWTLIGENFTTDEGEILVYISGTSVDITKATEKKLFVRNDAVPESGQIYVVSNGIEGPRTRFDFGKFYYPSIRSVSAKPAFQADREMEILGTNFGTHANADNVSVSFSKGGIADILAFNPKTKKVDIPVDKDWKVKPTDITLRLNNQVENGDEINMTVSNRGKKSNDLNFVVGSEARQFTANPWIHSISYPTGAGMGKMARIRGRALSKSDRVYFGETKADVIRGTSTLIDVTVPKGIDTNGKLTIESGPRKSNSIDYIAIESGKIIKDPITFSFAKPDEYTIDPSNTSGDTVLSELEIMNILGKVLIRKLVIEIEYDDSDQVNSTKNYGILPFGLVSLEGGNESIAPVVVKQAHGVFTLEFRDIVFNPATSTQTYQIKARLSPFVVNGSKFRFKFSPRDDIRAIDLDDWDQPNITFSQSEVRSNWLTVQNETAVCVDTDSEEKNCKAFELGLAVKAAEEEAEAANEIASKESQVSEAEEKKEVEVIRPKPPRIPLSREWDTSGGPTMPFNDIEGNPDSEYIYELKKRGVVEGFGNNDFQPGKSVNRAEFLKMVVAGLQIDPGSIDTSVLNFPDVGKSKWYAPYIAWAFNYGVVKGYTDGTFRPGDSITRAEALKIVLTAGAFDISKSQHPFVDLSAWQHQYVAEALDKGIIQVETNTLAPNVTINRSESAKLITLMLHAFEKEVD